MNTHLLSTNALSVIDQYLHFKYGSAVCSVPYFNNRVARARATLKTLIGKGSPKDIFDEIQAIAVKNHISPETLADESLKKLLVDNNMGIDCSAFAFYILGAENMEQGKGTLQKHINFINCRGLVGKIRCSLRPIENCDVATLADDTNSRIVSIEEIKPGDMITMLGDQEENERDHILVIHQVDRQDSTPTRIYYSHATAYPEDGIYGSGIRQGIIEVTDAGKSLAEQTWKENGKIGNDNRIFIRAQKSRTQLRRLKWF